MDPQAQSNGHPSEHTFEEEFQVAGDELLQTIRKLIHEGNVRHIIIKQGGRTLMEIPLAVGVVGVLYAPVLAAVGALAALVSECTIEVQRTAE